MCVSNQADDSEQMGNQEILEHPSGNAEIKICQLEEELHRAKAELEQYRLLYENLSVPYFRLDPTGKILAINSSGATHLRYAASELIGQPIFAFFCPEDVPASRSTINRALQHPHQSVTFQARQLCRDGQAIWVKATVKAIQDAHYGTIALLACENITATKQLEARCQQAEARIQSLQASEQRWRSVVENAPDYIFTCDRSGNLLSSNRAIPNFTVEQVVGTSVYDYISPEHQPTLKTAFEQVFQTGAIVHYETTGIGVDGAIAWYSSRVGPIWRDGQVVEAVVVCTDITERKQAEEALRQSQQQLETITANIPGVVYRAVYHADGRISLPYVSEGSRTLYGFDADEITALSTEQILSIFHPDDLPKIAAKVEERKQTPAPDSLEYRLITKSGEVKWIRDTASFRWNEQGDFIVDGVDIDITDRKRIEHERKQVEDTLRENEEQFRQLAENIQDVFWMASFTEMHQVLYVSPAYERIWQRSREHLYQQPEDWTNAIHPEDRDRVSAAAETMAEGSFDVEYRIVHPDGSVLWIHDRAFPVQAEDGQVYRIAGIAEDITERKRSEQSLRQQAEREQLLGDIARRIRQSLNLDEILNTTVTEVRQVLQADRAVIFRFQPDWTGVVAVESVAPPWSAILGSTIYDPCFAEAYVEQYRQRCVRTIENSFTAGLGQCHLELLTQFQVVANLVAPILQDEHLWGLLIVHQCSGPRQWQPQEVDLLKQLATQLEIAICQSQLFQQVQFLNNDLEQQVQERTIELQKAFDFEALLRRITDKVRDSLEESQILQTVVQELVVELQIYSCDTGLYNLKQSHSAICYEYVRSDAGIPLAVGNIVPFSVYPEVYSQLLMGQYLQFCWLPTFADPARLTDCPFAILAYPIMDDQGVIGDLWLYRAREDVFEDMEIRLIQQVANHCAIALRQSRLYQAAQAQVEELERLNHLKDDFLSTVSHELRTPVANIRMAAQMLEVHFGQLGVLESQTNAIARYLQVLKEECQREISLINDLLDLSRLEAETEPLMLAPIDLHIWLPHIAEPFLQRAQSQQQQLMIDVANRSLMLVTDISYLGRILTELLQNACKYTPANEIIHVTAHAQTAHIEICVSNTGVEIPEGELERIFDKFYRIPNTDPWKHGGTGLGLALVKRLVTRLDGTISVASYMRRTTFTLQLPQPDITDISTESTAG